MRFLIVSDIHGNRFGLQTVLEHAGGDYDQLLCLGDVVGYGAHPNECCELLMANNAISLSGNHDAAALGLIDTAWFNPVALEAILWTRRELTEKNLAWLRSLSGSMEFPEYGFQAVHGSLRNTWEEYIVELETVQANLLELNFPVCFFGHTHVAVVYGCPRDLKRHVDVDQIGWLELTNGGAFDLDPQQKYLVNPGSCGQPRDGNPQARYALFDTETREVQVRAIDYDWEAARAAIIQAGLPIMLGDRLLRGR